MVPLDHDNPVNAEGAQRLRESLSCPGIDQITRQRLIERCVPALTKRRRHRAVRRIGVGIAALLALTTAASWVVLQTSSLARPGGSTEITLVADVNADGVVDILDAHALAAAVEHGGGAPDLNGDGAATRSDADWIADRVTRLDGASG